MDSQVEIMETGSARIDSSNFIRYLQGFRLTTAGRPIEGEKRDFGKEIDLGERITKIIDDMSDAQDTIKNPGIESSEHGKVMFVRIKTGEIEGTSMVTGTGLEVNLKPAFEEALGEGGLPIIAVHDHPNEYMFTPKDYLPLIAGDRKSSTRMTRAIIVLLPNGTQLMAVATNETPIFSSSEKAERFLEVRDEEMKESAGNKVLNEAAQIINSAQGSVATELNVKLYRRVGKGNFKEFSV
jgi:hypothetical protein